MSELTCGLKPSAQILAWYDVHRRELPWRASPGKKSDPYRVWLSEIMLQQTVVKTVIPYFEDFLAKWPSVVALARADLDDVLRAWAGLGYYARARNLHACSKVVARQYGGFFPQSMKDLQSLPGIGPYTAAAIAAIAFDVPVVPLDGNIERVTARYFTIANPLPGAKAEIREAAQGLASDARAGDLAQALMDLGARICTQRRPGCGGCPLRRECRAKALDIAGQLPVKAPKKDRPKRFGTAYWVEQEDGAILLRRRPENGLLGGMMEIPSSPWSETRPRDFDVNHAPIIANWTPIKGIVRHVFTHFALDLTVVSACLQSNTKSRAGICGEDYRWVPISDLNNEALPSVMRKVARHALGRDG